MDTLEFYSYIMDNFALEGAAATCVLPFAHYGRKEGENDHA